MTDSKVLLPAEAARELGVPTRVIVKAMYERTIAYVPLDDGTLGIPVEAVEDFRAQAG